MDYEINKEQYKVLKKACRYYIPKTKDNGLFCNQLVLRGFLSPQDRKNKLAFIITDEGRIAIEKHKRDCETLTTAKSANAIAIISLVIASISALLSTILALLQLLRS